MLPDVFIQLVDEVNNIEFRQRSLAGAGSTTHILKSQVDAVPDDTLFPFVNTLTRYVVPTFNEVDGVILSVVVLFPLTQLFEFAFKSIAAQEVVLNICNLGLTLIFVPMLLSLILGKLLDATKEYQTSGEAELPQNALILAVGVEKPEAVLSVPPMLLHVSPGVNGVAFPHASFPGCAIAGRKTHNCNINSKIPLT